MEMKPPDEDELAAVGTEREERIARWWDTVWGGATLIIEVSQGVIEGLGLGDALMWGVFQCCWFWSGDATICVEGGCYGRCASGLDALRTALGVSSAL